MPPAYLRAPGFSVGGPQQTCQKSGFVTRKAAKLALKQLTLAGGGGMRVYKCPVCPSDVWHLGHPGETHFHRLLRAKRMARVPQE